MAVLHLTKSEFVEKVADVDKLSAGFKFVGNRPAVVDFYAEWCSPCRMLSPVIEDLALEYNGRVDFYKIDVDKEEALARAFSIRSIPTMLFISNSGLVERVQGAIGKSRLKEKIDSMLL